MADIDKIKIEPKFIILKSMSLDLLKKLQTKIIDFSKKLIIIDLK